MTPAAPQINKHSSERQEAETLSASLPSLMLRAEQLVSGFNPGTHGRRKSGTGEDFWQFRSYDQNDPASNIDWRQSAKRDQLFIRQNEFETPESVWFWCDSNMSMNFQSEHAEHTKLSRSRILILAAGLLLLRGGENFALLGAATKAAQGAAAFDRFAQSLLNIPENGFEFLEKSPYIPEKAKVILASDFLYPIDVITKKLSFLSAQGTRGVLLHIADPAEVTFPYTGRTLFEDFGKHISVFFGRAETVRAEYQQKFIAHQKALRSVAEEFGWEYYFHQTNDPASDALSSLYFSLERRYL